MKTATLNRPGTSTPRPYGSAHLALGALLVLACSSSVSPAQTNRPVPAFPALPTLPPRTNRVAASTNLPGQPGTTNPAIPPSLGTRVTAATNTAGRTNVAVTGTVVPPPLVTPAAQPSSLNTITVGPGQNAPPQNTTTLGTPQQPGATTTARAPGAGGQTNAAEEVFPPGLIKFNDADLIQVLDIYQELSGRTVMRPTALPQTKISIRSQTTLTRKEALQALDTILAMNQITMIPQGDKFVKAVPQAQATVEGAPFNDLPGNELDETTRYITQIVHLKNALPREVAPALQPLAKLPGQSIMAIDSSGILVLRDYEENIKRMLELLEKIDVVPPQEFEPVIIPIKYALAADIAQVIGGLTAGGGGPISVGAQAGGARGLTGGIGAFGGGGGAGGLGGYGNRGGLGMGSGSYPGGAGYNPVNAQGGAQGALGGAALGGAGGRGSFANRLQGIVNRAGGGGGQGDIVVIGQAKIIADERTNALLIFASKEDIKTIKDIIAKLDVVLPQVLIEAVVMEVSLNDSISYGFSYLQHPKTSGKFTGAGAINNTKGSFNLNNFSTLTTNVAGPQGGFSYFGKWSDDLDIAIEAVAGDSRINVLQKPRIQTSHAVQADLFVGETRPYITSTYGGGGLYGASSQYSQLQIGVTLSVLPLINQDGLVVMDIHQKIQSIGQEVIIDGNPIPATIDREANAKVSVRNRETIILGGFISDEKRKAASGVPFLKDIPILGFLFRNTSKQNDRRELVVLIRPTVLPTPEIAATTARDEKSLMPGITAAEAEANAADRKRLEKTRRAVSKDLFKREGFTEDPE